MKLLWHAGTGVVQPDRLGVSEIVLVLVVVLVLETLGVHLPAAGSLEDRRCRHASVDSPRRPFLGQAA
jgi:hypothetical protein